MFDNTKPRSENSGLVQASHDFSGAESLSVTIMEAVACAQGTEIENLDQQLFDVVDPDALDRLFRPTDTTTYEAEVRFVIDDSAVVIRNTGDVFVRPLD
ncbi:HalOD1 output domain-containing protein [Salinibaculum salinum]|uniref:HalOD1 output domain-containing protein n=1 Tax=Salinibaculum salinum TaxID=3131996 RepID=UPI0030EBF52E